MILLLLAFIEFILFTASFFVMLMNDYILDALKCAIYVIICLIIINAYLP